MKTSFADALQSMSGKAGEPTLIDPEALSDARVAEAMQDAWNDICSDTNHHPLDLEHGRGSRLEFQPRHWAAATAMTLRHLCRQDYFRLAAPPSPAVVGEVPSDVRKLELWFFRDLSFQLRAKLYRVCGHRFNDDQALTEATERRIFRRIVAASRATPVGADGWRDIASAPKDGTLIDVWCVPFDGKGPSVRLTDVSWHVADDILPTAGWVRVLDDGDWDLVESAATSALGLPPWKPTHWRLPPAAPSPSASEGGE